MTRDQSPIAPTSGFDLWLLVARHFTRLQLFQLRSLNSCFLNYWMDVSWENIRIRVTVENPGTVAQVLQRMVGLHEKLLLIFVSDNGIGTLSWRRG